MQMIKYLKAIVLVLTSLAINQTVMSQKFNIGAIAGVNASQISGDGYSGFNKAGIIVGGFANTDISEKINLQFEILYSEKGSRKVPKTDKGETDAFLLRLNYVEIPVMIRMRNNNFTYDVGTYYGQLVNTYIEDENGPFEIPNQLNQFKKSDFGFLIGVNYHFTKSLIMNWRYNNSILAVREHDSGANFRFNNGMFHSYLSFTLRYEFIGKDGS